VTGIAYRSTIKKLGEHYRATRARKTGNKLADGRDEYQFDREFVGYGLVLDEHKECLIFDEPLPFKVGDQVEVIIRKIESE
jgi:hypothetical protein